MQSKNQTKDEILEIQKTQEDEINQKELNEFEKKLIVKRKLTIRNKKRSRGFASWLFNNKEL